MQGGKKKNKEEEKRPVIEEAVPLMSQMEEDEGVEEDGVTKDKLDMDVNAFDIEMSSTSKVTRVAEDEAENSV